MYPVNLVLYQEARLFKLDHIKPKDSLLVFDTSALAYSHLNTDNLRTYLDSGGTIILEQHVVDEINHHYKRSSSNGPRPSGTDTRDLPRIATNGLRLISLIDERITNVHALPESTEEKTILDIIGKILPKAQAYEKLPPQFPALYDSLTSLLQFYTRHGLPLNVEELRGRGDAAFERLHAIVSDDPRMDAKDRQGLQIITDAQQSFLRSYCETATEKLGEYARHPFTLFGRRNTTIEHLKGEAQHVMDAILLRMLGYISDPAYEGRKENAIAQCQGRFFVDPRSQETDTSVILASYVPNYPRDKHVYLLSSDSDLRYSLRIRQVISEHQSSGSRRLRAIPQ